MPVGRTQTGIRLLHMGLRLNADLPDLSSSHTLESLPMIPTGTGKLIMTLNKTVKSFFSIFELQRKFKALTEMSYFETNPNSFIPYVFDFQVRRKHLP